MRVEQHGHGLVAARRQGVVGCAGAAALSCRGVHNRRDTRAGPGFTDDPADVRAPPRRQVYSIGDNPAVAIDQSAVGQRVSVRRRVEGGLTDVLGHLLDVTDDRLDVLSPRRGAGAAGRPT